MWMCVDYLFEIRMHAHTRIFVTCSLPKDIRLIIIIILHHRQQRRHSKSMFTYTENKQQISIGLSSIFELPDTYRYNVSLFVDSAAMNDACALFAQSVNKCVVIVLHSTEYTLENDILIQNIYS